jgi:hypothetical protein
MVVKRDERKSNIDIKIKKAQQETVELFLCMKFMGY